MDRPVVTESDPGSRPCRFRCRSCAAGVRHADVKVEIRQNEAGQVGDAREFPAAARKLDLDVAALGVLELGCVHRLQKIQGLGDAGPEIGKARFGVLVLGDLDAREACGRPFGRVAGDLHLARQRMHVGKQARLRENGAVEFPRRGLCRSLVENGRQIGQAADQQWNRKIVHGNRHRESPWARSKGDSSIRQDSRLRRTMPREMRGICQDMRVRSVNRGPMLPFSAACERNKDPILDVLRIRFAGPRPGFGNRQRHGPACRAFRARARPFDLASDGAIDLSFGPGGARQARGHAQSARAGIARRPPGPVAAARRRRNIHRQHLAHHVLVRGGRPVPWHRRRAVAGRRAVHLRTVSLRGPPHLGQQPRVRPHAPGTRPGVRIAGSRGRQRPRAAVRPAAGRGS